MKDSLCYASNTALTTSLASMADAMNAVCAGTHADTHSEGEQGNRIEEPAAPYMATAEPDSALTWDANEDFMQ
ncbi:MAG: hypothetical protein AWU57_374 [Marinobacter sp. T13-3]|nr:MAG: hypothetical protein AWU57_374 [Marinobacter sp. T13-3]